MTDHINKLRTSLQDKKTKQTIIEHEMPYIGSLKELIRYGNTKDMARPLHIPVTRDAAPYIPAKWACSPSTHPGLYCIARELK